MTENHQEPDLTLSFDPGALRRVMQRSQVWVAVTSGTSEPTVRLFEANQEAVTDRCRRRLVPVYQQLAHEMDANGVP